MYSHHKSSIQNITNKLKQDETVLAVIVGGSIAHGFATERSDVDIMIVISDEQYRERSEKGALTYWEQESCTYEGGYIDGHYVSVAFMEDVANRGNEASRYAFEGASIVYTKIEDLEDLLERIVTYPLEEKKTRVTHFYYQLMTWRWFCNEAISKNNQYLLYQSIANLILFGGRLVLAYNETLYPFHKWFLRVLSSVPDKPEHLMEEIQAVLDTPSAENVSRFCDSIFQYTDWGNEQLDWANYDLKFEEQNWMRGNQSFANL